MIDDRMPQPVAFRCHDFGARDTERRNVRRDRHCHAVRIDFVDLIADVAQHFLAVAVDHAIDIGVAGGGRSRERRPRQHRESRNDSWQRLLAKAVRGSFRSCMRRGYPFANHDGLLVSSPQVK
jgi:hypothetical protein